MTTHDGSPLDRLLSASLVAALALSLVSSLLYLAAGWEDATAALVQIVGAVFGTLLVVRLVTLLAPASWTGPVALLLGAAGSAGVVGYGFNTMAVGLGGVDLIDATGPPVALRVLGLLWPLALLVLAVALVRAGRLPLVAGIAAILGAVLYPVSRIADVAWLAVASDVLILALVAVLVARPRSGAGRAVPTQHGEPAIART